MVSLQAIRAALTRIEGQIKGLGDGLADEIRELDAERWEWLKTCLQAMADDSLGRFQAVYTRLDIMRGELLAAKPRAKRRSGKKRT